jgi:hypothetical protein
MQRRLTAVFGILGALAGIAALIYLMTRDGPKPAYVEITPPPLEVPETPPDELRAERQQGTLRGIVVNGQSGRPISGARVAALRPYLEKTEDDDLPLWGMLQEQGHVFSGEDGTFAIEDLPPDYWNLWVERSGYAWTTVPRAKFKEEHRIELFPECSIRGRVVYPDDSPAAGVRIEYTPQGTHSEVFSRYRLRSYFTETDADGRFEYTQIPHGLFTVEVYPEDHLPAPWIAEPPLLPGQNRDLGTHKLDPGFGMTVYVKYRETEEPVEGIEVVVRPMGDPMPRTKTGRTMRTDANGVARFSGLGGQVMDAPTFLVAANVDGVGVVLPETRGLLAPDQSVTIYLRKAGTVKGEVVGPKGEPVEIFLAELRPDGFSARQLRATGTKGEFTIHQVPGGPYTLFLRTGRLVDRGLQIEVEGGRTTDVGVVTLQEGAVVTGTVRLSSGHELEGVVRVHLARRVYDEIRKREDWQTVSRGPCRKDGSYTLTGVPEGSYFLWPEQVDRWNRNVTDPVPVEVRRGEGVVRKDLVVYGEGSLDLVFRDRVTGGVRQVVPPTTYLVEQGSGKEVRWFGTGTPLRPGRYQLVVELPDETGVSHRYAVREVVVQEGETTGPIEVALHETRDGGQRKQGAEDGSGDRPEDR